jgi:hypothetical protein
VIAVSAAARFFLGAIRIPGQKPSGEHNRCELRPGTPKTPARALPLVVLMMASPLYVVCFGWPCFQCEIRLSFMIAEHNYGAHSAQVKMRLVLPAASIRITHLGPDFVLVESPPDHPPCEASVLLRVDDSETQWSVRLPNGISKGSKRVALAACGSAAPSARA